MESGSDSARALQVPNVTIPITSSSCSIGWVRPDSMHCFLCPAAQYSFNTSTSTCDSPCPPNADCLGGASMRPHKGFWVSAYHSDSIVACPNPEACQGDRTNLSTCLDQLKPKAFQVCAPLLLLSTVDTTAVSMPTGCIAARQQMGGWASGMCMCKCKCYRMVA